MRAKNITMNTTTIYVLAQTSCTKWIFCDRDKAFELGLHNYEGRKITGYQKREDAIKAGLANSSFCEPFAILRVTMSKDIHESLTSREQMNGTSKDEAGRPLWVVSNDGSKIGRAHV